MNLYHVGKSIIVFLGFSFITSMGCAQAWGVAAPTQDETLIYVLREGRFTGGGAKMWIAVNDQTVARVKNRQYAVIRAKSRCDNVESGLHWCGCRSDRTRRSPRPDYIFKMAGWRHKPY